MHTDRIGNGADTAPRAMAMAALLVLLAGLTVWLGLGTLRDTLFPYTTLFRSNRKSVV